MEHNSGRKVVEASTKEKGMSSQLYSLIDVSAAKNLGTIFAQRCLQAGFYEVHCDLNSQRTSSKRVRIIKFLYMMQFNVIYIF